MAYQPKSYRKFVATTATAAMVASAVAPVVSAAGFTDVAPQYKDAIDFLVSTGATNGKTETKFGVYDEITRLDAAVILAKVLKLDVDNAKDAGFTDVPADRAKYVNALVEAGILNGKTETRFGAYDKLTRVEMAKIIANAYNLKGDDVTLPFTDVNDTWAPYVKALYKYEVTKGKTETKFGAYENITRGDFAQFVYRAANVNAVPEVISVSAINPTTLKVEGEGLKNLKAEDVTVAGNKVTAVNASADGKTATLTLENALVPNKEVTVTVKVNGETKEFKVTFEYTIDKVTVNAATYDDDQKGQVVTFKVNDETTNANPEYLRQAGYDVKFVAVNEKNQAANIFAGSPSATSTSSTGLLADEVPVGKYTIEVQILKDGKVVVSDKAVIEVVDLESTVTAIDSVELTNNRSTTSGTDDFVMNSTTLVTGESATITDIVGDAAGKKDVSIPVGLAKVETSNPAVVSVDSTDPSAPVLTANAPGTATITVKIGNVTKTINLTVTNTARKVAKVTPSESSVKLVLGAYRQINVTAYDQYGDPIGIDDTADNVTVLESVPKDASGNDLVSVGTATALTDTDNDGKADSAPTLDGDLTTSADKGKHSGFVLYAANKGTGTVLFKDKDGKVIGQIGVTVTDRDNVSSTKLEVTYDSASTTNSLVKDGTIKYQVSKFNSEGAYNGKVALAPTKTAGKYYVSTSKSSVATVTVNSDNTFTVNAVGAGTADIVVYDENDLVKHKFTVTVTEPSVTITKVNFKGTATVDYVGKAVNVSDVLDVRPDSISGSAVDPIVYGIEHNANTFAKVRLASSADTLLFTKTITYNSNNAPDAGKLVIYIDNGTDAGELDDDDTILGLVTAQVLTGATGNNLGALAGNDLADITVGGTNYTTGSKDKGTILFKVFVDADKDNAFEANEVVASTTINVDVK